MAGERDVVDIDDAADKSEAESGIKWTYHCDSENSTNLGESYKSFAPAMSSLAQVADKLQGIFQSSFPALESLKAISQRMQNLIPGWQVNRPDFTGGSKFEKMEPLWKSKKESVTPKKSETKRFGWSMSTKASTLRSGLASSRLPRSSV